MHKTATKPWTKLLLLGAASSMALACNAQGIDAPGNTMTDGEADLSEAEGKIFESNVKPILMAKCASCHMGTDASNGPDFLGPAPDDHYKTLIASGSLVGSAPENSTLVLKGQHKGPPMSPDELLKASQWIVVRAGGDPSQVTTASLGRPTTLDAALGRFGACMSAQEWVEFNVNQLAAQNSGGGQCSACHGAGGGVQGAFYINGDDPVRSCQISGTRPYILKWVKGTVDDKGNFKTLVKAYRTRDRGQDICFEQPCHPEYTLQPPVQAAIDGFLDRTFERYNDFSFDCGSKQ